MTAKAIFPWTLPALFDTHDHLREDNKNQKVVGAIILLTYQGGACVITPMSNTEKGLLTAFDVTGYISHAKKITPQDVNVQFVPMVQITESTTQGDIDACVEAGIYDAKGYPYGRTTKSHLGVRNYSRLISICQYAGRKKMRIHLHPEHPEMLFDNRDAEFAFLPVMDMLLSETEKYGTVFVWEHGTDARCIPFWKKWAKTGRFLITLTSHHLAAHESETYGDVQATCKPPYKVLADLLGLRNLVAEDHEWVMAGSDGAAHDKKSKHVLGPCACGAFTNPFLLPLYAHALSDMLSTKRGRDTFVRFTSGNASKLYGIPVERTVTLSQKPFHIPPVYQVGTWEVEPFWAGRTIDYSLV